MLPLLLALLEWSRCLLSQLLQMLLNYLDRLLLLPLQDAKASVHVWLTRRCAEDRRTHGGEPLRKGCVEVRGTVGGIPESIDCTRRVEFEQLRRRCRTCFRRRERSRIISSHEQSGCVRR